jgi:hypothetical protein
MGTGTWGLFSKPSVSNGTPTLFSAAEVFLCGQATRNFQTLVIRLNSSVGRLRKRRYRGAVAEQNSVLKYH